MFWKIILSGFIFFFTFGKSFAWIGLVAENGDLLNILKWNEMITDLNTKITQSDVTGTGNIDVTNLGSGVLISLTGSISSSPIPYITTATKKLVAANSTATIYLSGSNFVPSSVLQIPGFDGTVNSTTVFGPDSLQANITSGPTVADYDLVVSNAGVLSSLWSGNGSLLLSVIIPVIGTGVAGTYLEDFELGLGSWVDSGLTGSWTRDSGGTPSNGTGPLTGAGGSTWYIYTEVSSGANTNVFGIETTNFRHALSVSLDYHMVGTDIGTLSIQTLNAGVWTVVWSISGQQQAAQADPYINTGPIDLSSYQVEAIRIVGEGATSWAGDIAVDNISIVSD